MAILKNRIHIVKTKKLKASSLMEVIVATVIIVLVFGMVTLILNNLLQNNSKQDTHKIELVLNKCVYRYKHDKLELPYQDNIEDWNISTDVIRKENASYVIFRATQEKTDKEITRIQIQKRKVRNPY